MMHNTVSKSSIPLADLLVNCPGITDSPADIEAFITQQIDLRMTKLKSLMARRKLSRSDICQDFIVAIMEAMPAFNPARSTWRTYLSRVINNRYCNFRRQYQVDHKSLGTIVALDGCDENQDIPTYQIDFETPADVEVVMDKLPARLRQYAELLKTHSPSRVAAELNVTRSSVGRAIKRIREYFLHSGFEKLHGDATN
jgi:RNA polymerase sigma factor (sigma-70 family)